MAYRIQTNLFGGCDLYRENESGLSYIATYTSEREATRAKEIHEYKDRRKTAQTTLNIFARTGGDGGYGND